MPEGRTPIELTKADVNQFKANYMKPLTVSKILFVDDDPLMHKLYKPHVERAGYEWVGARDARAARRRAPCRARRIVREERTIIALKLARPTPCPLSLRGELRR